MRCQVLATDYDGTLATNGKVGRATARALTHFVASGRKLVLVTGRQLDDLEQAFAHLALFERVVAENGAVLFAPATRELRLLDEAPSPAFAAALRDRGVAPVSVGRVIVATRAAHERVVLETIRAMGLALDIEMNKSALMVLPTGINKATGLSAALADMGLSRISPHAGVSKGVCQSPWLGVVGVGDAENDLALLSSCEWAVSVANALPSVKARSHWVTPSAEGQGVIELIERALADDLP
jgi:hydroxymethylpyrimidine pyrophosphatase-like HAD family hydrolase